MVTSGLFTVSFRRIAYRLLSIHGRRPCLENTRPFSSAGVRDSYTSMPKYVNGFGIRSYASMPKYGTNVAHAYAWDCIRGVTCSVFRSRLEDHGYSHINIPGFEKKESNEDLCLFLCMPGVKIQDVKVCVERNSWLAIKAATETHDQIVSYEAGMRLPDNVDKMSSDIKGEIQADGMFKLTFPKLKDKKMINISKIFDNFIYKLTLRFGFTVLLRLLIVRKFLIEPLCDEESNSFTMYTEVTADSCIHMSFTHENFEKMELTREGVCVSVNIPELKIEDVKSYLFGDVLFIKGTTRSKKDKEKMHYYITAVRLPKNILKKRNMIKTEMKDGMYKATFPYVTREINII